MSFHLSVAEWANIITTVSAVFTWRAAANAGKAVSLSRQQLEDEREARLEADVRKVVEDRLKHLYGPAYSLSVALHRSHGAHIFLDLPKVDQDSYIRLLSENNYYGDAEFDITLYEFLTNLNFIDADPVVRDRVQSIYQRLNELIFDTHTVLREKLGLPPLGLEHTSWSKGVQMDNEKVPS